MEMTIYDVKQIQVESIIAYKQVYEIDLNDMDEVINYIEELGMYASNWFVRLPLEHLHTLLERKGYEPNLMMELTDITQEEFARFIIGQTMYGIEHDQTIYPSIQELILVYKEQYLH